MSCNSVATVSSKLTVDQKILLGTDPKVIAAVQAVIAKALNVEASQVSVRSGEYYMTINAGGFTIQMDRDGRITTYSYNYGYQSQVAAANEKVTAALNSLAGIILQTKVMQTIQKMANVTETQRQPTGAVVMTFNF
jgi:hypothetical protein